VRSPKPFPAPAAPVVWRAVACLVAVSTVRYALVSGADVQARLEQLAGERHQQARQERRLFWRMIAIATFIAIIVTARLLAG
jgi:phosphatidylglycerophosphate synthase